MVAVSHQSAHPAVVKVQINLDITKKMKLGLDKFAADAGMSGRAYTTVLLEAAYSARHGSSGDIDLDTQVARTMVLWGSGKCVEEDIAKATKLSVTTVITIIKAWRDEIRGAA